MQNDKKIRVRFLVLIFSVIYIFTITVMPMFGADNKIKTEFGKPISNETAKPDKTSNNENPETIYKAEIYNAAGLAFLRNGDAVDGGDFYRAGGRKIRLFRSLWKVAVWQKEEKQALNIDALNGLLDTEPPLKEEQSGESAKILKTEKRMTTEGLTSVLNNLRRSELIRRVAPVFINEETGREMVVTPRIVVKLAPNVFPEQVKDLHQTYNAKVVGCMHGASDEIILDLQDADAEEILSICEGYLQDSRVLWASPDFLFQLDLFYTPDDTLYSSQWHLHNTGQSGATADADVDAPEAWDISTGSSGIVIAIIDTGVEITHPDLNDNIYINLAESGGVGGVDDDGNGYIDDVNGWDFYGNDNDPNSGATQGHGTCCAGVAAGEGDNTAGIAGIAYDCEILPVKICSDIGIFASSTAIGNAIRYAADMADVLSNSWGGGGDDSIIHSAIQYAVNTQGKPVFFASGNYASGFYQLWVTGILANTYTFKWEYSKDAADSYGEDSVWLDGIMFPEASWSRLKGEPSLP